MSTTRNTSTPSESLVEPEWLSSWRAKEKAFAASLPHGEQYGIGIRALEEEEQPTFDADTEYLVTPSKGLELYTWKEAIAQEEISVILERLFSSTLLPHASSSFSGLARAHFNSGLVVYVQPTLDDEGHSIEETLTLETMIPAGASADMLVVIAKTGARLKLASEFLGGNESGLFARTMIVLMEEDAHVRVSSSTHDAFPFLSIESLLLVGAHASCDWREDPNVLTKYRSRVQGLLLGEGARCEIFHTLLATDRSAYDIWGGVEHAASHTFSRVYALGVAADSSRIVYRGKIDMKKGVSGVDGAQEAKFLIVSRSASIDAIPALDIASRDVQSSHKLSVSHIRAIDLFYAKTRGISDIDARSLAMEGFFGTLVGKVGTGELSDDLRSRIALIAGRES